MYCFYVVLFLSIQYICKLVGSYAAYYNVDSQQIFTTSNVSEYGIYFIDRQ